jgi:hypothetical protein
MWSRTFERLRGYAMEADSVATAAQVAHWTRPLGEGESAATTGGARLEGPLAGIARGTVSRAALARLVLSAQNTLALLPKWEPRDRPIFDCGTSRDISTFNASPALYALRRNHAAECLRFSWLDVPLSSRLR